MSGDTKSAAGAIAETGATAAPHQTTTGGYPHDGSYSAP